MASVFTKDDKFIYKQPRNTYDLSFQNNLTTNFGKLVPVLCQEVLPGDSFRIKPTFGLRFMPQVFPVQTRMRAHIHYFYVRNRTLWKDWTDFIGRTKEGLVPPYLKLTKKQCKNLKPSTLYDYLGLPTWLKAENKDVYTSVPDYHINCVYDWQSGVLKKNVPLNEIYELNATNQANEITRVYYKYTQQNNDHLVNPRTYIFEKPVLLPLTLNGQSFKLQWRYKSSVEMNIYTILKMQNGDVVVYPIWSTPTEQIKNVGSGLQYNVEGGTRRSNIMAVLGYFIADAPQNLPLDARYSADLQVVTNPKLYNGIPLSFIEPYSIPICNEVNTEGERVSALAPRAYQAVFNAFYRNAEVTPFVRNGVREYNVYVTNDEGGADSTDYDLFNRPWSDDRFTTCRVSPQAGEAPIIGLTGVQGATFTLSDDDGTTSQLRLQVDSSTGKVISVQDSNTNDAKELTDAINSAINYGITIADLRNVNSFQKWLENKNRVGFKYRDQLMAHYGVKARYDALQMPEFIGGVSRDVVVNQISQTVETDTGNLGDIAGQAGVVGSGENVSCYCDEHGFIIGIMSVVPSPMYSQTMPKHLLKSDAFDYFFPEFGKIGFQPILNKEISFVQSHFENKENEVFGYQRAWSDYLENLDSVHGLFQSDLKNFLLGRVFGSTPQLSGDFLYVNNKDLNNIFYVDDENDKILGQVYHDIKAKRQIPLYGIPELE